MLRNFFIAILAVSGAFAQAPLPQLKVEPTGGGSYFYVKNTAPQPLTGYLIELVDYPGSSYSLWTDEAAGEPLAPGAEKKTRVSNMTVGAVPDYVKLEAAIYADGSTAGVPEKVAQFIERRKQLLATTRELIVRMEKPGTTSADLRQWADSLDPGKRLTQASINSAAARGLIFETAGMLDSHPAAEILAQLKAHEKALAEATSRN